jgi:site-specific DNA-methyltransferase (adenine-specific)
MNILVFNANAGQFPIRLRKKYPNAKILCCEYFEGYEQWLQKIGFETCRCYKYVDGKKVLTFEALEGMKFDLVTGNPPYQDGNESSFTNLWTSFVLSSWGLLKDNGYCAFISPKTWTNQIEKENGNRKVFNLIQRYAIKINIDECSHYFPDIGSSFSYYILNKSKQANSDCSVTTRNESFRTDLNDIDFIPKEFTQTCLSILKKLLSVTFFNSMSSSGTVGEIVAKKDHNHPFSVRYSMGTEKWSNTQHLFQFTEKLIFPNQTTKNYPIYAPTSAPANRGVFFPVKDKEEAEKMLAFFKSKIISFFIAQQRNHHGMLNTQVIKRIPKIDLTRTWTDVELYSHFGLTEEEIQYIEGVVR